MRFFRAAFLRAVGFLRFHAPTPADDLEAAHACIEQSADEHGGVPNTTGPPPGERAGVPTGLHHRMWAARSDRAQATTACAPARRALAAVLALEDHPCIGAVQGTYQRERVKGKNRRPEDGRGHHDRGTGVPGPAVTGRWTSTAFVSGDLLQLQHNSMSPEIMDLVAELIDTAGMTWKAWGERPRFNFGAVLSGDDENKAPAAWARLLPETGAGRFGRDPRYAKPHPLRRAARYPRGGRRCGWVDGLAPALRAGGPASRGTGGYLSRDLGLATSSDPAAEVAVWLKARGTSLAELVDVNGFTVVPWVQANWFIGLASADSQGQDVNSLARTWTAEMCDSMHLDGHETVLRSLRATGSA